VPTIDAAVMMRDLSGCESERAVAAKLLQGPRPAFSGDRQTTVQQLGHALAAGVLLTYAQGMHLLRGASMSYGYQLHLSEVARIWRGGCIIRAAVLEDIAAAFHARPDLPHLLLDAQIAGKVMARQADLRAIVRTAADWGIAVPCLMASLAYYDSFRSGWLPANLVQAQRDYFGAHTYERVDEPGTFHTQWNSP
jgi:6-phosphogluconate dehydrogenase